MSSSTSEAQSGEGREADVIALDDAIALLPEGESVHTFINAGFGLIGADWSRAKIINALRASPQIRPTGPMAQAMKHGMVIKHPDRDECLFVATTRRTDEPSPASLPQSAVESPATPLGSSHA